MGYYKNIEVEQQEQVDQIVRWYKTNADEVPAYLMSLIINDATFLTKVIDAWEDIELATLGEPKPRPASDHVALQVTRRELRPTKTHGSLIGWSLVLCAILTGAIILWVSL